jgi:hypothetical protein
MAHGVPMGHLTAHELGHLLLGAGSHSSSGIMHVPWHKKELEAIAQFLMWFTPSEEGKLRAGIRCADGSRRRGVAELEQELK